MSWASKTYTTAKNIVVVRRLVQLIPFFQPHNSTLHPISILPLYGDKPPTQSAADPVAIVTAEVETQNRLIMGFTRRYESAWIKAFQLRHENLIGELIMLQARNIISVDVVPTLLEAVDLPAPGNLHRKSFWEDSNRLSIRWAYGEEKSSRSDCKACGASFYTPLICVDPIFTFVNRPIRK